MDNANAWACNDKDRGVIAQAIKKLPGFVSGNGVFVSTAEITRKLEAFSAYIFNAIPTLEYREINFRLLDGLLPGIGKLIDCKLKPGSYLESAASVASWELVSLVEKNGFLFFAVKALGSDKVCEFPADFFRPADQKAIKKKLAKWKALEAEKPNGGADDENERIALGGALRPKILSFVVENDDDLEAIQNDLRIAGLTFKPILEDAADFKSLLPWRLFVLCEFLRVAKTEAGFIYEVEDLSKADGSFAKLVEIGESRICEWQLRNGLKQGEAGPETSRSL